MRLMLNYTIIKLILFLCEGKNKKQKDEMKILSWNVNQGKDYRNLIDMINILNDYRSDVIFA